MDDVKVVTLCGSTRFKKEFKEIETQLTLAGNAVLSPAFFEKNDSIEVTREQAELFGKIHFKKIDLADEIVVLDVNGYIGESTQKEIEYATKKNKLIKYYSENLQLDF